MNNVPERFITKDQYKLINGAWSIYEPYGYCHFAGHRGYISKTNFKTHKCAKKQCHYFEPNPNHYGFKKNGESQKTLAEKKMAHKRLRKEYLCGTLTLEEYQRAKEKIPG